MGRRRGRRPPFEINFYANTSERSWGDGSVSGIAAGVLLTLLFVGGILVWIYLFSLDGSVSRKILFTELAVNAVLLGINVFLICRVGYDGFLKNLLCTWGANLVSTDPSAGCPGGRRRSSRCSGVYYLCAAVGPHGSDSGTANLRHHVGDYGGVRQRLKIGNDGKRRV